MICAVARNGNGNVRWGKGEGGRYRSEGGGREGGLKAIFITAEAISPVSVDNRKGGITATRRDRSAPP